MPASQLSEPDFQSPLGKLYQGDCLKVLPNIASESVDLIFADPPFNLGKSYASGMNDDIPEHRYLAWCKQWIEECVRVLKPGGSFFLYNLPKWNLALGSFLSERLTFRHWIAIDMPSTLPIAGRLYPSHYSLIYYCKGPKPKTFSPDRVAMATCPKCFHELKDYGGYKDKMNPLGVNLSDVWKDIPPVRHSKFKRRDDANELSIKLLDRVITMASRPGDVVLDPFGGSGSTYIVAELKSRRWLGMELGPIAQIIARMGHQNMILEDEFLANYRADLNALFPHKVLREREKRGFWTPGNIPKGKSRVTFVQKKQMQSELVLQEAPGLYTAGATARRSRKNAKSNSGTR